MQTRLDIILETVRNILSTEPKSSEQHIETFVTRARKQNRPLTSDEKTAIQRHKENIITRERTIHSRPKKR